MKPIRETQKAWKAAVNELLGPELRPRSLGDRKRLAGLKDILSKSKTGKALVDWANINGVEVWLDRQLDGDYGGFVFSGTNTVILNAHCSNRFLVTLLAHELMHIWQDHQNLIPVKFDSPANYVISMRLCEAAAYSAQSQIIEELEQAGYPCRETMVNAYGMDGKKLFENVGNEYAQIAAKAFRSYMKTNIQTKNDDNYRQIILNTVYEYPTKPANISTFVKTGLKYKFDGTRPVIKPRLNMDWVMRYGRLPNNENLWIQNNKPIIAQKDIWPLYIINPKPFSSSTLKFLNEKRARDKSTGRRPFIELSPIT